MMDNLPWILLVLACPVGMLLMGGVMWLMAKGGGLFHRDSSKPTDSATEVEPSRVEPR